MRRAFSRVVLTGGAGHLGRAILRSNLFPGLLAPSHQELDITDARSVQKYFKEHKPEAVIHTAAIARMSQCEKDPITALKTNLVGTANLVEEVLAQKKSKGQPIRFVYISSDGVYESTQGRYSEKDATVPYNKYGWTKLGGECAVNLLPDFCIIRTRFYDPERLEYDSYATDSFTSSVSVNYLVQAIKILLGSDFCGTINVGGKRSSDYDLYRKLGPKVKACRLRDYNQKPPMRLSVDSSLNLSLWQKILRKSKTKIRLA